MPKLFGKKKNKKKLKLSIRDALTPTSAFVAVPSTPPPQATPPANTTDQLSTLSPPPQATPPSHHVLVTTDHSAPSTPLGRSLNQGGTNGSSGEGGYCLAQAPENYSDEEPGYATVGDPSYPRPRLPSPRSSSGTQHTPSQSHNSTDVTASLPHGSTLHTPSQPHNSIDGTASLPHSSTLHTPSRPQRVRAQSHSQQTTNRPNSQQIMSTSDLPSVTSALSIHSNSTSVSFGLSPPHTTHPSAVPQATNNPQPLSQKRKSKQPKVYEKIYQEVFSPLSDQDSAKQTKGTEHLYTKVKKSKKHVNDHDTVNYSYVQHCQGCSTASRLYHTLEPPSTPHIEGSQLRPQSTGSARKSLFEGQPQMIMKQKSRSVDDLEQNSRHANKRHTLQCVDVGYREEENSVFSSCDGTVESEGEIPEECGAHFLSKSLNLPSQHRSETSKQTRTHRKRRKSTGTVIDDSSIRTIPLQSLQRAQVVQPNFIQQQGNVYVFSEQLPDGRLQYYSAMPVQDLQSPQFHHPHTPTQRPHTPTQRPHTPTQRPHTPTQRPHTPTQRPHTPTQHPHTPVQRPHTPTPRPHTPNTMVSHNLTESGYLSSPPVPSVTTVQPSPGSVLISNANSGTSTLITPLPDPTVVQDTDQINTSESPLMESMPQDVSPPSSPVRAHFKPPTNKYKHLLAQFESREIDIKARNTRLVALNKKLNMEISTLEKKVEDLRNNNKMLQSKVQSLSSESSLLRGTNTDQLTELSSLKSKLSNTRDKLASLREEHDALLAQQQASLEERGEWERVASHAHSVLNENTSLLKAQEMYKETVDQLKRENQSIELRLNGEVERLRREQKSKEDALRSLKQSHNELREKFDELAVRASRQVPLEEHQSVLMELQRLVTELDDRNDRKLKSQEAQMRISDKDKKYLVTKLTDAKALIYQLEGEVAQLHQAHKRAHEKVMGLQRELEITRDREVALHNQLSRAVLCADKAASERDTYARIARSQEQAREREARRGVRKEPALDKTLETHRQAHLDHQASALLQEQDREHRHKREQYRQEIGHLKSLLAQKQTFVDKLIKN